MGRTLAEQHKIYEDQGFYFELQFPYPDLSEQELNLIRNFIAFLSMCEDDRIKETFKADMSFYRFYQLFRHFLLDEQIQLFEKHYHSTDLTAVLAKVEKISRYHSHKDNAIGEGCETREIFSYDITDPGDGEPWVRIYTKFPSRY